MNQTTAGLSAAPSANPLVESHADGRIDFIDGLRGLAMLVVLLHHHWIFTKFTRLQVGGLDLQNPLIFGYLGVHLFLVVSGFCLAWPYAGPSGQAARPLNLWPFIRRRFIRLAPAYYVALVLSALPVFARTLIKTGSIPDSYWWDLSAHFLWLHNLNSDYLGSFNNALWSLGLEFQLYLIFPLFLLVRNRFGMIALAGTVLLLQVAYRTWLYPVVLELDDQWAEAYSIAYIVPGRMFEFVAGMIVAGIVRKLPGQGLSRRAHWALWGIWAASGGLAGWLVVRYNVFHPLADALWAVCFASIILLCFVNRYWRKALESGLLVRCGMISYSVYLIHFPIGLWLGYHFYYRDSIPLAWRITGMCLYPCGCLVAGWFFHRWFEKPFLKKR